MKDIERDQTYIQRMIEHCDRILEARERFGDSYEDFVNDADYRDAVCMNIFQIGELVNQISDETKERHDEIPWSKMYGTRNILAHAYIKVDDKVIWQTVEDDIPELKAKLEEI